MCWVFFYVALVLKDGEKEETVKGAVDTKKGNMA